MFDLVASPQVQPLQGIASGLSEPHGFWPAKKFHIYVPYSISYILCCIFYGPYSIFYIL